MIIPLFVMLEEETTGELNEIAPAFCKSPNDESPLKVMLLVFEVKRTEEEDT